jgi:iron complex transport system permease protein
VLSIARKKGEMPVERVILAGVIVGAFLWSLVTLLLSFSGEDAYRILLWLMGSLSNAGWASVKLAIFPIIIGCLALLFLWRELDVFSLGEEVAGYLGVETNRAKILIVIFSSLAVAGAVSTCGIIGFIGLISPHIARRLVGYNHKILLPASYFVGASILLLSDTLAKTLIAPAELPVGAITALLGAPFFAYLLQKKER